jgi:hypothetical protein
VLAGSFVQIVVVVAFLVLAALVLKLLLAPDRKRAAAPAPADSPDPDQDAGGRSAEARFQRLAARRLRPLLDAIVVQAAEHGRRAVYVRQLQDGAETWRIEVEQPDLPSDQPRPYLAVSRGPGHMVSVVRGGVLPPPADENDPYAAMTQRDVDWQELDRVLLRFAERTFQQSAPNTIQPGAGPGRLA